MKNQRFLKKERISTKDRFRSVLRGEKLQYNQHTPWFRQRGNVIILIVIVVIFFLSFAVKAYYEAKRNEDLEEIQQTIQKQQENNLNQEEGKMDYEEAKRIFQGTSAQSSDS